VKKTVCNYCGVGCEIGFDGNSVVPLKNGIVSKGKLCIKGRFGHEFVEHPQRIKGALVRKELLEEFNVSADPYEREGEFFRVPYELAYEIVSKKLKEIVSEHGAPSFAAIGGARTNCESGYIFQKFAREVIGTPHVDNCARICHAPSLKGLRETVGEGAASVPFDEIYNAEFIFVLGSNTTEAHPIVAHRIIEQARKGIPLAVLDVRETGLFKFAKYKLTVPFESNLLFLNCLSRVLVEKNLFDSKFVKSRVLNFEEFKERIISDPLSDPRIFKRIPGYEYLTDEIHKLAEDLAGKRVVFLWGLGITEHEDGSESVMAIANLSLLLGSPRLIPLRGQNNVQGACDVGMLPYFLPGYRKPKKIGWTTPEIIEGILEGKIRALWVMGEDLAHVHPNLHKVRKALKKLELLVVNEIFPCETTKFADVVFGVKSGYEKTGVYINAERRMHLSEPVFKSSLPDDWEVIANVAKKLGKDFGFNTSEDVWDSLRKEVPERFGNFSYEVLRKNFERAPQWFSANLFENGFPTDTGKARFVYNPYRLRGMVKELLESGKFSDFYLTTGRILLHYNNSSQTSRCKTLEKFKLYREDIVYASEKDRERLKNARRIKLISEHGETPPLKVEFSKYVRKGTLFATFHRAKSSINSLFGDEADKLVKTAKFKSIKVKVEIVETDEA